MTLPLPPHSKHLRGCVLVLALVPRHAGQMTRLFISRLYAVGKKTYLAHAVDGVQELDLDVRLEVGAPGVVPGGGAAVPLVVEGEELVELVPHVLREVVLAPLVHVFPKLSPLARVLFPALVVSHAAEGLGPAVGVQVLVLVVAVDGLLAGEVVVGELLGPTEAHQLVVRVPLALVRQHFVSPEKLFFRINYFWTLSNLSLASWLGFRSGWNFFASLK